VIVNLDTLEYLDPVKFGQIPTLAGMVSPAPKDRALPILKKANQDNLQVVDVAGGLFVMLCHPQRRGGGDIKHLRPPASSSSTGRRALVAEPSSLLTRRWREVDSNFRFRAHGEVSWSAVSLDIPRGMRHGVRRSTALSPARLAIPWNRGRIRS
jgi:hypothetical protein